MADFNGRIEEIVRVFEKYPAGDLNTRITVRRVLAAERAEAFEAGYGEGMHDQREAQRSNRERAEKEQAETDDETVVMSRCECGGLAHHQAGCRWRQGYGSVVITQSGETATAGEEG